MTLPDLGHDSRSDDERLSHVPDPEEEAEVTVPQADAGLAGEHNGVGSLLGSCQLGEHYSYHEGLQDDPRDAL